MTSDSDERVSGDDSAFAPGTGDEENPFEQEEVLPSSSRDYDEGKPHAEYVPEDAVVEYGQDGQEFFDPAGSASVEDDSVFLTESIGYPEEPEEPQFADMAGSVQDLAHQETLIQHPSSPKEKPAEISYDSQLDKMFPDDGFNSDSKLDWESREEPSPPVAEQYPPTPGFQIPGEQPPTPPVPPLVPDMEGEGVPDSPSGYVVITPSGRKKGVSPEIAQLLDRTSKRKDAVTALEEVKKSKKKWVVIIVVLVLLFAAAAAAAVYEYLDIEKRKKLHQEFAQQANSERLQLKNSLEIKIDQTETARKDLEGKLNGLKTEFQSYKDSVRDRLAQVDDLEKAKNDAVRNMEETKLLNQKIPVLEKQLEDRDSSIDRLGAELEETRKNILTLENSNTLRGTSIKKLNDDIRQRDRRLNELQEEIDSLTGRGLTPKISASEYARLLDDMRKKNSRIEMMEKWSKQLEEQIEDIHTVVKGDKNILDQMNDLRMDLLRLGKDRMKLQEDLKSEQEARRRYSSPENTIAEWAQAHATGKLDVLMKFYAENNRHRKCFEEGSDEERGRLAAEFREFSAYRIEPQVLSVTINPGERRATAKLRLRLTLDGRTVEMPVTMLLVREYEQWAILSEGF